MAYQRRLLRNQLMPLVAPRAVGGRRADSTFDASDDDGLARGRVHRTHVEQTMRRVLLLQLHDGEAVAEVDVASDDEGEAGRQEHLGLAWVEGEAIDLKARRRRHNEESALALAP
jgi:hypothetical protein